VMIGPERSSVVSDVTGVLPLVATGGHHDGRGLRTDSTSTPRRLS